MRARRAAIDAFLGANSALFAPDEDDFEGDLVGPVVLSGAVLLLRFLDLGDDSEFTASVRSPGLGRTQALGILHDALEASR